MLKVIEYSDRYQLSNLLHLGRRIKLSVSKTLLQDRAWHTFTEWQLELGSTNWQIPDSQLTYSILRAIALELPSDHSFTTNFMTEIMPLGKPILTSTLLEPNQKEVLITHCLPIEQVLSVPCEKVQLYEKSSNSKKLLPILRALFGTEDTLEFKRVAQFFSSYGIEFNLLLNSRSILIMERNVDGYLGISDLHLNCSERAFGVRLLSTKS